MALDFTYSSYPKVEGLIQSDFYLSAENSESNYGCMERIFYNYNNQEIVKRMGERINERGGFQALQANLYILCRVFSELLHDNPEREPELRPQLIIIKDSVNFNWEGVGDWRY